MQNDKASSDDSSIDSDKSLNAGEDAKTFYTDIFRPCMLDKAINKKNMSEFLSTKLQDEQQCAALKTQLNALRKACEYKKDGSVVIKTNIFSIPS